MAKAKIGTAKIVIDAALMLVALTVVSLGIAAFRHAPGVARSTDAPATERTGIPTLVVAVSPPGSLSTDNPATKGAGASSLAAVSPSASLPTVAPTPGVATDTPARLTTVTAVGTDGMATLPARPIAGGSAEPATAPAGIGYRDPQGRFSFVRPMNWRVVEAPSAGVAVQFNSDIPRGNVNVATQSISTTMTVDQFASAAVADIERTYPGYQIDPQGIQPSILGEVSARRYSFRGDQAGVLIEFSQVVAVKDGTVYVVTVTAAATDSDAFAAQASVVIETFTFHA